jgi:ATP-dependent Lhr-like helicase
MAAGRVEALRVPMNCLDVLAQQVIAMTAMEDWLVSDLYHLVRQAYPYRDLTPAAFDAVLEMVTGRYRFTESRPHAPREVNRHAERDDHTLSPTQQLTALQPRISWDRVHQKLQALPGSQRLALVHGGTIPDTGQYAVYTMKGLRIGEVDEEFVYERRIGDTFLLGTNAWRIDRIETDRVLVYAAEGMPAMVPFWRGESTGRSYDLGLAQGKFLRELCQRMDQPDCLDWLQKDYFLDGAAARNLRDFVQRQWRRTNCMPTDQTLLIEASRDPLGDWQVILLSPFGRSLNLSLRLALEHRLHERLGYRPQCLHHDDGILIRLTESDEPVLDLFEGITPENVRDMILEELADSALFALRFRQNAARALMMPRGAAGKRAPLWLQRLRGRDLLQVARQHPDFPIIAETFRECLHDHLDLPRLQQLLGDIATGNVQIETRRLDMPSPFAAGLLFAFTAAFMYQYDDVEPGGERSTAALDQTLLDQLIGQEGRPLPLDPRAVQQVDRRLRGVGHPPRSKPETAEWLRRLGDISRQELEGPVQPFLRELEQEKVVTKITLPNCTEPVRWIMSEEAELYRTAFASDAGAADESQEAAATILQRFLDTHALIGLEDVLQRYPFERGWAQRQLEAWTRKGRLVRIVTTEAEPMQWSAPDNFEQMQRGTLSILRREVMTCPAAQFVDFVLRWQCIHPARQLASPAGLPEVLHRLHALALPRELWEQAILPMRCKNYLPRYLDDLIAAGQWTWHCQRDHDGGAESLAFIERESLAFLPPPVLDDAGLDSGAASILELLRSRGALFAADLATHAKLPLSFVRASLWSLLRQGLVTNDQYDLLRKGEPPRDDRPPALRSQGEVRAFLRHSRHRRENAWPEGRWSLIAWGQPDPEAAAFFPARLLLDRYGIAARELANMSGMSVPWRILYEILSRMELAGEVRRGYFVEGLSGAQFALPEAAKLLHEIALPSGAEAPILLVHSLDPANLYGSGAALELMISAVEPRTFQRRSGNWLMLKAGRPLLLIELQGKRLTAMSHATNDELAQAVARLPELLKLMPKHDVRHKLTVETWNDQPVTGTVGKELLEQAGFVRDYQAMTLYAVWHS